MASDLLDWTSSAFFLSSYFFPRNFLNRSCLPFVPSTSSCFNPIPVREKVWWDQGQYVQVSKEKSDLHECTNDQIPWYKNEEKLVFSLQLFHVMYFWLQIEQRLYFGFSITCFISNLCICVFLICWHGCSVHDQGRRQKLYFEGLFSSYQKFSPVIILNYGYV